MTVPSTYVPPQYTGNGATVAFAFSYNFFDPTDLLVNLFDTTAVADVAPQPVLNGGATYDYIITGSKDADTGEYLSGATITFNNAPLANHRVTISRSVPATQNSLFINNSRFPAKSVEAALDRSAMMVQQTSQLVSRAPQIPASDGVLNMTLPVKALRANKYFAFDANGLPQAADPNSGVAPISYTPVTVLVSGAGSAGAPAYTRSSDTDTGMYFSAANTVDWSTNGVQAFQIDPTQRLHFASVGNAAFPSFTPLNDPDTGIYTSAGNELAVSCGGTQVARFTAGQLIINNANVGGGALSVQGTGTNGVGTFYNVGGNYMFAVNAANLGVGTGDSAVNAMCNVRKDSTTNRSMNLAGTLNASGADYAEFEKKALDCGDVLAGQVIGFDVNGHITDKWAAIASRCGVKSTDPTIVGGDKWGTEEALGMQRPVPPPSPKLMPILSVGVEFFADQAAQDATLAQFDADMKTHAADLATFAAKIEAARLTVDRIAYAGKCPCNVLGANVGDYIVPAQDGLGIKGVAIAVPTFDQYRAAVGRVVSLLPDGRCTIALMVH